jgi:hypothetical protein
MASTEILFFFIAIYFMISKLYSDIRVVKWEFPAFIEEQYYDPKSRRVLLYDTILSR